MSKLLKGKLVADKIKEDMKKSILSLKENDIYPNLAIIRLGDNSGDISYERAIIKNCDNLGIKTQVFIKNRDISTQDLVDLIEDLNKDNFISGILLFRPLPNTIDENIISNSIDPDKDIDCMHPLNLERIFEGDMSGFCPCTPKAAIEILNFYNIDLKGKDIVIVNRSMVVGKPLAMMLLEEDATVTICHSKTKNLKEKTKNADIVITALGKANFFGKDYFKEDSILIDVGVSLDKNKKLSGDGEFNSLNGFIDAITPVPGGVGSVTTSILLSHVVKACSKQ